VRTKALTLPNLGRVRMFVAIACISMLAFGCTTDDGGGGGGGGGGGDEPTAALSTLPALLGGLDEVESEVADAAALVNSQYLNGAAGPPTDGLRESYNNVRTKVNAWITEYQTAVQLRQAVDDSYPRLEEALKEADVFLSWTAEWDAYNREPSGAMGGPVAGGAGAAIKKVVTFAIEQLPTLVDSGLSVWQETRDAEQERLDETVDVLDGAKWPTFDELLT
jgi:hypothetical protein